MKKNKVILSVVLLTTFLVGQNVASEYGPDRRYAARIKDIMMQAFPDMLNNHSTVDRFYYGFSGRNRYGEIFTIQRDLSSYQIRELFDQSNIPFSDCGYEFGKLQSLTSYLDDQDANIRFMALYAAFDSCNYTRYKDECSIAQALMFKVINDQDDWVKSQIMLMLSEYVRENKCIDVACRYALQYIRSDNPILKMWAFEIIRSLIVINAMDKADSILVTLSYQKHPLLQLQYLLLDRESHGQPLDVQAYIKVLQKIMQSDDWQVRFTGLHMLKNLQLYSQSYDFVKEIIGNALSDQPLVHMQALIILKNDFLWTEIFEADYTKQIVLEAYSHQDWQVRLAAALFLMGDPLNIDDEDDNLIRGCVNDEHPMIRTIIHYS